jgi:4'-phosphopantetheinyl transferase EntD
VEKTLSSEEGQVKKDAAVALVQSEALKRGITLDIEQLENAVEAAVLRLEIASK